MDFHMDKTEKFTGVHYQVGVDYLLNKHVGIGLNAGTIYGRFLDSEGVISGSMEKSVEIYRVFINGGLNFYF